MKRALQVGLAAALVALVVAGLGLLQLRQQNENLERQAAESQAQIKEAKARLEQLRAENGRLKLLFERRTSPGL